MESSTRRSAALSLLAATGMRRGNYAPPGVRLLWLLGVDVPPPHFADFSATTLAMASVFGVMFGLVERAFQRFGFPSRTTSLPEVAIMAMIYGVAMASYYAHGRRKYGLPPWRDLGCAAKP